MAEAHAEGGLLPERAVLAGKRRDQEHHIGEVLIIIFLFLFLFLFVVVAVVVVILEATNNHYCLNSFVDYSES